MNENTLVTGPQPNLGTQIGLGGGWHIPDGSDGYYPEEAPARRAAVDGLWIDAHPVTNREFARFVAETGHVTIAEREPDPEDYQGARAEMLVPGSSVFQKPSRPVDLRNPQYWWRYLPGADWRYPQGPAALASVG